MISVDEVGPQRPSKDLSEPETDHVVTQGKEVVNHLEALFIEFYSSRLIILQKQLSITTIGKPEICESLSAAGDSSYYK